MTGRNISIINLEDSSFLLGQACQGFNVVELNFSKLLGKDKNNSAIKAEIVETLAHEVRHTMQFNYTFLDRIACSRLMSFPVMLILCLSGILGGILGNIFTLAGFGQWLSFLFFSLSCVALLLLFGIFLVYYFSPNERNARAFARRALQKEEWLKVVKVENIKDAP